MWSALSEEKAGLLFTIAADPRQLSSSPIATALMTIVYFLRL